MIDALPAAVYVAASVPAPGSVKHVARGDLVVGPDGERTKLVAEVFARAEVPCRISDNIAGELWTKLLWNCALNAVSALGQARYGRIAESLDGRGLVETVVEEVLAVARAIPVVLPGLDSAKAGMAGAMKIATQMASALSSTAQDVNRGKLTEIDSLNGYVSRQGANLGVPTPVNRTLFTLVKLLEGR
jgi:2-dehydropantoate 2-reductase